MKQKKPFKYMAMWLYKNMQNGRLKKLCCGRIGVGLGEMGEFCMEDGSLAKASTADGLRHERRKS